MSWRPPPPPQYAASPQQQSQQNQQQPQQNHQQPQQQQQQQLASYVQQPEYSHSAGYIPYQYFANVAQRGASYTSQWPPPSAQPALQPTPWRGQAHSVSVQPRGKGLSYAELLSKAEAATAGTICSPSPSKIPKKRKAESSLSGADVSKQQQSAAPPSPPPPQVVAERESPYAQQQAQTVAYRPPSARTQPPQRTRTLAQRQQDPLPKAPERAAQGQYPPSLLRYVERAFGECKTAAEKEECQMVLKASIERSRREDRIWTTNWDVIPTPLSAKSENVPKKKKNKKQLKLEAKKAKLAAKMAQEKAKGPSKKAALKISNADKMLMTNAGSIRERNARFADMQQIPTGKNTKNNKFDLKIKFLGSSAEAGTGDIELDWEALKIRGTSTELEKEYLRLTSAPDPSTVRPEPILRKAVKRLVEKWEKDHNYFFFVQQMKAIRQDLTIQHIVNSFTISVYEMNARICLEVEDFSEYNQCQTQLAELYTDNPHLRENQGEFFAYQIYYYLLVRDYLSIARTLSKVDTKSFEHPQIKLALQIRQCVFSHDYVNFFRLCQTASELSVKIIRHIYGHVRHQALRRICKAFRPTVPVSMLCEVLGLGDNERCEAFLLASGATLNEDGTTVITKECTELVCVDMESLEKDPTTRNYGVTHGTFTTS